MDSSSSQPHSMQNVSKKQITKFEQAESVHRQLLYDLMSSIYEFVLILTSHAPSTSDKVTTTELKTSEAQASYDYRHQTPNVESLLIHIHSCLEQIFLNGLRIFKPDVSRPTVCHFPQIHIASSDLHANRNMRLASERKR